MSENFGKALKQIRLSRKMTLEEMADLLGTTKQALSRYERGERTPKITAAAQFAEKLGVDLEMLVNESGKINLNLQWFGGNEDEDRLEALHQDPRLRMLFDRSRKMSDADKDKMIKIADVILGELYPDE